MDWFLDYVLMGIKGARFVGQPQRPGLRSQVIKWLLSTEWREGRPYTREAGSGYIDITHTDGIWISMVKKRFDHHQYHWQRLRLPDAVWSGRNT
jgi:hypothetical protein